MFASLQIPALISKVRLLSDKRGSNFVNDDEITTLLQDAFDMLHAELVEAHEGYFTAQTEPATPTNKNEIVYPDDLYKVRLVEKFESDTCHYPLSEKALREVSGISGAYYDYSTYSSSLPYGYVLFSDRLRLYPADGVSGQRFRLTYAKDVLGVANASLQKGWENHLTYKTAYVITCLEDNPRATLGDLAKEWQEKIIAWASERDSSPKTIVDLDGRQGGGLGLTFY